MMSLGREMDLNFSASCPGKKGIGFAHDSAISANDKSS